MVKTGSTPVVNGLYVLEDVLAHGEAATTWAARRRTDGREVVLKVYGASGGAPAVAEARRLRAVRHPAVVEVLEVGAVESVEGAAERSPALGAAFVATVRVPGADLDRFLDPADGRSPAERVRDAVEILAQALAALAHLHRRGIVHRDLHPGNVRVARDERGQPVVTLLDFDLAVPVGVAAPAAGRLAFIPPEQLLGRPDPRSDLWALAAAVRWCLVRLDPLLGRPVLPTVVAAWAPVLLRSPPVALARVLPAAPEAFLRTIDACLAREPERRPPSARAALALLDPARAERTEAADPLAFDPPFVGRAAELTRVAAVLAGEGRTAPRVALVVDGPEAAGRRRLVAEAAVRAAEQAVLGGRAVPAVVRLRVEEPRRAALELRDALAGVPAGAILLVDATELGEGAGSFLEEAAGLVRAFHEVGGAAREGGSAPVLLAAAPSLRRSFAGLERVSLGPLSEEEAGKLLGHALVEPPAPPVVRELFEASGGWPGLLLAEAAARFPDGRPVLGGRSARAVSRGEAVGMLGPADRRALIRLAVEPLAVPEDRLGDDGGSPPDDVVLCALPRLQRLGWIRRGAAGFQVTAERRKAAERLVAPAERRRMQRRLAQADVSDPGARLRRSYHRLAVADRTALAGVVEAEESAAGELGTAARASVLAWALARDAGVLPDPSLLRLARDGIELGRYEEADRALAEARRRGLDEPGGRCRRGGDEAIPWARWVWLRATLLRRTGNMGQAEGLLNGLVHGAGGTESVAAGLDLVDVALTRGDAAGAERIVGALGDVPEELAPRAAELRARVALARGDADAAQTLLERALARLGEATGTGGAAPSNPTRHRLWSLSGAVRLRRGDVRGAVEAFAAALAAAQAAGDRHEAATYAANLGSAVLEAGRAVEAVQRLRGAALDLTALGARREQPAVLLNLANALVRVGDSSGAARVLEHARATSPAEVWRGIEPYALALRADAARQRGACDEATALLREALARPETAADQGLAQSLRFDLADLLGQAGDAVAAEGLLDERSEGPLSAVLEVKRGTARLRVALAGGPLPDARALEAQARALAALPEPRDRLVEWRALVVLAAAARRGGRVEAARRAAARAERAARAVREEVREMGFDPLGDDPDRKTLEDLLAEPGRPAPAAADGAAEGGLRREREVRRWLSIQRRLVSERHPARLLDLILETLIEIVGAERGMLLTRSTRKGGLVVRRVRNLASGALGGVDGGTISLSIAEEVARTGEPVVTMDARQDGRFLASRSVHDLGLRSVMVLPLIARGRTIGVAYLDHRLRESAFEPASVEVALDFAGQAALVLETARHLRLLRLRRQEIERLNAELRKRVEEQATELRGLKETIESALPPEVADPFPGFVGRASAMRDLFRRMKRVAETDLPVLILGESGTGKELVARALFARGRRREAPFVTENCAAIPESLLESILFGHVRGAFTGADRDHAGLFVVADRGTLFLDEIGEMSLGLQSKLLRVLEDGEVRPVGGTAMRKVDVRILAASNRDLEAMVREGKFREDLYYRLAVLTVRLPPLRERIEDIPLLAAHFLEKHAGGRKVRVTPGAMRRLAAHGWPGNVRQLENTVVRALVLAGGDTLDEECIDLGGSTRAAASGTAFAGPEGLDLRANVVALERGLIERALEQAGGNRTRAAGLLGLSRYGLLKKLQRGATEASRGGGPKPRGSAGSPRR